MFCSSSSLICLPMLQRTTLSTLDECIHNRILVLDLLQRQLSTKYLPKWQLSHAMENWYHKRNGYTLTQAVLHHNVDKPWTKMIWTTTHTKYHHQDISKNIDDFNCDYCQCVKITCKRLGLWPECDLTNTPWYKVVIYLTGQSYGKTDHFNDGLYELTYIETTINLVEQRHIVTISSDAIVKKF